MLIILTLLTSVNAQAYQTAYNPHSGRLDFVGADASADIAVVCDVGKILKSDGAGAWSCQDDDGGVGSGDITSVGDVATGAAFDGTQGTTLTFNDADGDKTILYNTTSNDFEINDDLSFALGANRVLQALDQTAADTNGISLSIFGSDGLGTGNAGGITIFPGYGGVTGDGGNLVINNGESNGGGLGGNTTINPGWWSGATTYSFGSTLTLYDGPAVNTGTTLTQAANLYVAQGDGDPDGTITTGYGILIDDFRGYGTSHYNIASKGLRSNNVFEGRVYIGNDTGFTSDDSAADPIATLHVNGANVSGLNVEHSQIFSDNTTITYTNGATISNLRFNRFMAPVINETAGGSVESITNPASTLYIEAAPSGTITYTGGQLALWVDAGTSRFDGNMVLTLQANPTTSTDGEIATDTDGWGTGFDAIEFFNGTASSYLVATTASDTPTNGQVPKFNTGGSITWEDDTQSAGSETKWNAIADADADGSIALAGFETDFTSTLDSAGKAIWTIYNTDAATSAATTFIDLFHDDGADSNVTYLRGTGDQNGTPQIDYEFKQSAALIRPDLSVTGTIGTTGGLTLDATTEANIEAGVDLAGEVTATDLDTTLIADSVTVTGWVLGTSSATTLTAGTVNIDLLDGVGAVDMDYGSADITDHTFTTDGTGDAEIVLPDDSIGDAEIAFDEVTGADLTLTDAVAVTTSGTIISNSDIDVKHGATSSGLLRIFEDSDDGTNKATFQVPALAADTVYTLPADDGDAGEQLQTNGSGTLTWEAKEAITAGDYLTRTADDIDLDAEVITDTKCIWWENPVAGDDFKSVFENDMPTTLTVTKLWCESDQTVNTMLQVDDGSAADMDSVDLACISTPDTDTSLDGDATIAAGDRVDVDVASVSGTPTWVSVCFTYTKAD